MASHTISSKLQKGRWTPEYCTVIHLLFTNLTYRSMAAQRVNIPKIFRHLFANDLAVTHPDGVTDNQIADYYRSRKCAGRSKNFQAIEAAELSDEQLALVASLTPLIRTAVEELELEETPREDDDDTSARLTTSGGAVNDSATADAIAMTTPDEHTVEEHGNVTSEAMSPTFGAADADSRFTHSNTAQEAAMNHARSTTYDTTISAGSATDTTMYGARPMMRPQVSNLIIVSRPEPAMLMVHFHELDKHSGDASRLVLVDPECETYRLGGKVYRVTSDTDGTSEDLLVCNMPICPSCKDDYVPKTMWDNEEGLMHEAGRVEGLPFVHTADCFRANMPYWYFEPQIVGFPPRMWRTRVAFRIKGTRGTYAVKDAMMCDADECPDCMTVA
ncbi:hypothetical protein LTR01_007503 [Friedmanniomyces endolithicus]|nr:hypothetical protein LTR01_007503 [Friedmanniomyces endolithicus]KAK0833582.1 hypothetical protein LTR73_001344 [Friedmanniomyces endolithicus]